MLSLLIVWVATTISTGSNDLLPRWFGSRSKMPSWVPGQGGLSPAVGFQCLVFGFAVLHYGPNSVTQNDDVSWHSYKTSAPSWQKIEKIENTIHTCNHDMIYIYTHYIHNIIRYEFIDPPGAPHTLLTSYRWFICDAVCPQDLGAFQRLWWLATGRWKGLVNTELIAATNGRRRWWKILAEILGDEDIRRLTTSLCL